MSSKVTKAAEISPIYRTNRKGWVTAFNAVPQELFKKLTVAEISGLIDRITVWAEHDLEAVGETLDVLVDERRASDGKDRYYLIETVSGSKNRRIAASTVAYPGELDGGQEARRMVVDAITGRLLDAASDRREDAAYDVIMVSGELVSSINDAIDVVNLGDKLAA